MQSLIDFLVRENSRVEYGDKWLCGKENLGDTRWTVYQRRAYAKKTIVLYSGFDLEEAIRILENG